MEEINIQLNYKSPNLSDKILNILNYKTIDKSINERLSQDFLNDTNNVSSPQNPQNIKKICYVEIDDDLSSLNFPFQKNMDTNNIIINNQNIGKNLNKKEGYDSESSSSSDEEGYDSESSSSSSDEEGYDSESSSSSSDEEKKNRSVKKDFISYNSPIEELLLKTLKNETNSPLSSNSYDKESELPLITLNPKHTIENLFTKPIHPSSEKLSQQIETQPISFLITPTNNSYKNTPYLYFSHKKPKGSTTHKNKSKGKKTTTKKKMFRYTNGGRKHIKTKKHSKRKKHTKTKKMCNKKYKCNILNVKMQ
jgi:hypothetical protein